MAAGDGVGRAGDMDRSAEYTEQGLFYADRAIALDPTTPRGWWVRGVALERLGLLDEAVASFLVSVTHSDGTVYLAETHKGLARVYDAMGDAANAEIHRLLAEPESPEE